MLFPINLSWICKHGQNAQLRGHRALLQHSDKSSLRYASAGRLMFGLENDWVWLSF
jgi:hypothetical protein